MLTTHNDALKHWKEQSSIPIPLDILKLKNAIAEFTSSGDRYIDVHAWQFTPDSFLQIIDTLNQLELIHLKIEAIYETRHGSNEFWAILS